MDAKILESYRVMMALDAWVSGGRRYIEQGTHGTDIKLWGPFGKRGGMDYKRFEGSTFDAARAAAVKAIESGDL